MESKERDIQEKEQQKLRNTITMLERDLLEKEDDLQIALSARNPLCQPNTIDFGTVEIVAPEQVFVTSLNQVLKSPREEDACEVGEISQNLSPIERYNENNVNRKLKRKRGQSAARNLFQLSNFYDDEANVEDDLVEWSEDDNTPNPCDSNLSSFINELTDVPITPQIYNNFPKQSPEKQIGALNLNELTIRYAETCENKRKRKRRRRKKAFLLSSSE